MITIYGDPISGNCLKVKWTAEYLGIPFAWKTIDLSKAETRTPAFLALNPAGQIPTVVLEDGRPLAQSNAIILHLAEGSPLIPADAYDRAKMLEWMFWEQYSHEPTIAVARFQMKYLGKRRDELDPKLFERGEAALWRLEHGLVGDFLVGSQISLADISLVAYTRMAGDGGFKLSDYPAIGWLDRPCRNGHPDRGSGMNRRLWALAVVLSLLGANQALAWGSSGHRMIGRAAIESLPPELPPFLRTEAAAAAVGELSREPDRSRGAGRTHDSDRDPGHFVDADDQGRIAGVLLLGALPATRDDYEKALRATGASSWTMGYLPFSIIADWQQLRRDFAYWRVDDAGARHVADPSHRAWLEADRARRESQILVDIGLLSHFVGDGSMPLHVSIHFNGWGAFPNPNGYTESKIHVPWEGAYVRQVVDYEAVRSRITPFQDCGCPIEQRVGAYLASDLATVIPFYELEKSGAFKPGNATGVGFTVGRLVAGAAELRDEILLAWRASESDSVGYQPAVSVADVEAGKIDPYESLFGVD